VSGRVFVVAKGERNCNVITTRLGKNIIDDYGTKRMSEASSFIREIDDSPQYRLPSTRFVQVSSYRCIRVGNRMYVRSPVHQRVELESSFSDQAKNSFFSSSH
jgi:hypothetical protein